MKAALDWLFMISVILVLGWYDARQDRIEARLTQLEKAHDR